MTPFAIAGIQMPLSPDNNIPAMGQRLDLLMHLYPWVQMVLFSELAPFGAMLHHAQPLPGPAEEAFQEMAARHGVWLLPGSLFERRDGLIHNTAPVINPQGEVIARHRKLFPFEPYEQGVTPGNDFVVFDVDGVGRFGVLICYDLWFPETSRTLTAMGAEVILHPVLTHTVDRDADLHVAYATAVMFQCYVFDINGLGAGGNGHSCVIDPSGRTLHRADGHEQLIPIEIDLDQVRRQRERGFRTLGQPLKSFRDRQVEFPVYDRRSWRDDYLHSLGPLQKPRR
ncbi:MAG: carbon-nitrogen hydrolase family protein [Pseudomonadota bacterium]|nr:carbon-nitrogen hydrolase family protein [Pseudomonadota bacterium]